MSRQFTVADGKLDSGTLQLTLSPKLSGTFQFADGSTISNGSLSINSVNTNPSSNYSVVVRNGTFSLYLPDGNYQVSSLYKHDSQESLSVNYTFTITGGQSSPSPLSITLPAAVTGTISNFDGTPVASGRLYVNRTDSGTYPTYFAAIKDGEFTLYLPDGNYRTYNLNTPEEQMIGFYQSFSVSGGKTSPNPLEIKLPKLFTGKLSYSDGSSTGNGSVYLQNTTNGNGYISYSSEVIDGQFSVYLPDGTYKLTEFNNYDNSERISLNYSFTIADGQSAPDPIKVVVPKKLTGTVVDSENQPVNSGRLYVRTTTTPVIEYATAIKDSRFTLYLPDGSYQVYTYYDSQNNMTPLSYSFTVLDGQTVPSNLNLIIPSKNVTGTVKYSDGRVVENGTVYIFDQNPSTLTSVGAKVKNGSFSVYLPDGDYKISSYYSEDSNESQQVSYTFKVVNNKSLPDPLSVVVQLKNITGTLQFEDGSTIKDGFLSITEETTQAFVTIQVKDGKFSSYLPDGKYKVDRYNVTGSQENMYLTYNFTVAGGNRSRLCWILKSPIIM